MKNFINTNYIIAGIIKINNYYNKSLKIFNLILIIFTYLKILKIYLKFFYKMNKEMHKFLMRKYFVIKLIYFN